MIKKGFTHYVSIQILVPTQSINYPFNKETLNFNTSPTLLYKIQIFKNEKLLSQTIKSFLQNSFIQVKVSGCFQQARVDLLQADIEGQDHENDPVVGEAADYRPTR